MEQFDDIYNNEEELFDNEAGLSNNEEELFEHWKVEVDAKQDPVRIDKYLADKMAYQSRNRIQQAADAGFIQVNGKPAKASTQIKVADIITVKYGNKEESVEVLSIEDNVRKDDAKDMYKYI